MTSMKDLELCSSLMGIYMWANILKVNNRAMEHFIMRTVPSMLDSGKMIFSMAME